MDNRKHQRVEKLASVILFLCLLKLQSFLLNARKKDTSFQDKGLEHDRATGDPWGCNGASLGRRRQGIWDQLHPHQAHSHQPVGRSSEGETTHRGTTFHLCCFIKSLPRSCCSCSKWQHSSGSSLQQHFTFCLRDTDVRSLFQNTPMPQAFRNLWRMGQI